MNFVELSKDDENLNAENLLEKISNGKWEEIKKEWKNIKNDLTKSQEFGRLVKELKEAGYISAISANNYPLYHCHCNMSIETYRKRLEEHREVNASNVTNIDNSTHNNLNITGDNNALKDVSVSSDSNN